MTMTVKQCNGLQPSLFHIIQEQQSERQLPAEIRTASTSYCADILPISNQQVSDNITRRCDSSTKSSATNCFCCGNIRPGREHNVYTACNSCCSGIDGSLRSL